MTSLLKGDSEWVMTCPECGTKEDETVKSMFSVSEPAIRRLGDNAECIKCGFRGRIPPSLLSQKSSLKTTEVKE